MTKNYIFRQLECNLTIEETCKLCFKTVRTIKEWDNGKKIPPECVRLMRMQKRMELSYSASWNDFYMIGDKLRIPTGDSVAPQQILLGIALTQVSSEIELNTTSKILRVARSISKVRNS